MKMLSGTVLFSCLNLAVGFNTTAQTILNGKVTGSSGQPISYANIGILNSSTGTLSNADGSFNLIVPDSLQERSVTFSAIGFHRTELPVKSLKKKPSTVRLKEKVYTLKNITVTAKRKQRRKWLGNAKKHLLGLGQMHYDSSSAGGASALLIQNDNPELQYVEEARLYIMRNTLPKFKIRIRLLEINENGLPGDDLIHQSIVVTSGIRKGWLTFDLSPYNIKIEQESFYLMFEWIYEDADRHYIARQYKDFMEQHPDKVNRDTVIVDGEKLPTVHIANFIVGTFFGVTRSKRDLISKKCYTRESSFGAWERDHVIISAKILLSD